MSGQIIYVNREAFDLGDISDLTSDEIRTLAKVPDHHDLWQIADWGYREKLGGPMVNDEKVEGRVYLGPKSNRPARFFTAPRYIGNGSTGHEPRDTDTHWANGIPRLLTPEAFDRLSAARKTRDTQP